MTQFILLVKGSRGLVVKRTGTGIGGLSVWFNGQKWNEVPMSKTSNP